MTNPSKKFGEVKNDFELEKIIRKKFRIPVSETGMVFVVIARQRYQVLDMGPEGIRIALDNESDFELEQKISECELIVSRTSIKNLDGQVIHISAGDEQRWQCGIRWTNLPPDAEGQIREMVSRMKSQLLKDDVITFDDAQG